MTEAIFDKPQESVRYFLNDHMVTVCLCLNGRETEITHGDGISEMAWTYDYHEFTAREDQIDLSDVLANPEKYADYAPPEPMTEMEKHIAEQEEQIAVLTACLLEMSEMIYA